MSLDLAVRVFLGLVLLVGWSLSLLPGGWLWRELVAGVLSSPSSFGEGSVVALDNWFLEWPGLPPLGWLARALFRECLWSVRVWWGFESFSLWAPGLVTHPRGGPSIGYFRRLTLRFSAQIGCGVVLGFLAVGVVWRLYNEHLKSSPGEVASLWLDLPTELPGSVVPKPLKKRTPHPDREFVRSCGRRVPVTSAVAAQRLRRRARWVRALETILGRRDGVVGNFVRGRWTPDLPSPQLEQRLNYVLAGDQNGVRCLGGGTYKVGKRLSDGSTLFERHVYLVMDKAGDASVVFPELVGKLRQYALYRERDVALLGSLRTRAVDWCKAACLPAWVSDLAVSGAVPVAFEPSTHESLSHSHVRRATGSSLSIPFLA